MADIAASEVAYTSGAVPMRGYLARPTAAGVHPGVIVIQEWWGLNAHIKGIADRFAREGFVALAPDLYSRQGHRVTKNGDEAGKLMQALSHADGISDLLASIAFLKTQPGVDAQRIGATGFCMGGTFALLLALRSDDIKASVPFYGQVAPSEQLSQLRCPVLYIYGGQDGWITRDEVSRLDEALKKYRKPGEVRIYPDAPHAFFNDTRPEAYRPADADDAWRRALQFLRHHLG